MIDFIARKAISAVEENIETRFSESAARTPRFNGKFKYLAYYNGTIIRVQDFQTSNFYEVFQKEYEREREQFMVELKQEQE